MLHDVLTRMIERGDTEGLLEKIGVFFAVGRLTKTEYDALTGMLSA